MRLILTPTLCLVLLGMTQLDFGASSFHESDDLIKETWADGWVFSFSTTRPTYSRRATVFCLCESGVIVNGGYVNGFDEEQTYSIFLDKLPDKKYSKFHIVFLGELNSNGYQAYHSFKGPWYEEQSDQIEQ